MTLERQITVGRVVFYRGVGDLPGDRRRRHVGVEVLQPQKIRVPGGVGGIADLVDADSRDMRETRYGHKTSSCPPPWAFAPFAHFYLAPSALLTWLMGRHTCSYWYNGPPTMLGRQPPESDLDPAAR